MNTKPKFIVPEEITVVIPAYNEAKHIGGVLSVLNQAADLAQIIVVDDGSQDDTTEVVAAWRALDARIELIRLETNRGKGRALMTGVKAACHDLMLFLDADLMGLKPYHIHNLIHPVRQGESWMTLGVFGNGRWQTDLTHRFFPFLSGQRCLRWSMFRGIFQGQMARWSIETAFNLHAWYHYYPVRYIAWPGVTHATRTEKQKGFAGHLSHLKMWWEIGRYTAGFFRNYGWRPKLATPVNRRPRQSGYARLASSKSDGRGS